MSQGLSLIVRGLLTASTDVTDLVGTRIYPKEAPDDTDLPIVVYSIDLGGIPDGTAHISELTVEVNVYSHSDTEAQEIAEAVDAALHDAGGVHAATGNRIYPLSRGGWAEDRDFDNNEWIRLLRYTGSAYV